MISAQTWVTLRIHYSTSFGESLNVTGSGPFGDWKDSRPLTYDNGEWSITTAVPAGQNVEYKYYLQTASTKQWGWKEGR